MTGYESKKAAALDKLKQWDNKAFNDWWDSDYDDSTNPYKKDTFAYWAWAGWQAALAQPAQELTLQEQLVIAQADRDKADADWRKADRRINTLMEQQNG
jgi:hypothetical protein